LRKECIPKKHSYTSCFHKITTNIVPLNPYMTNQTSNLMKSYSRGSSRCSLQSVEHQTIHEQSPSRCSGILESLSERMILSRSRKDPHKHSRCFETLRGEKPLKKLSSKNGEKSTLFIKATDYNRFAYLL